MFRESSWRYHQEMKINLVAALLFMLAGQVKAETPAPRCVLTFRTAVNESEPLYFRDSKTQNFTGYSYDVLQELTRRTGCTFEAIVTNRSRAYQDLLASRTGIVGVTIRNSTFDKAGKFVALATVRREILVSRQFAKGRTDFNELLNDPNIRFITLPGASFFFEAAEAQKLEKESRFVTTTSLDAAYDLISKKSNLAIMQNDLVHGYFQRKRGLDKNYVRVRDEKSDFQMGFYYNPKRVPKPQIQMIEQAMSDMHNDGTYEKLTSRYRGSTESELHGRP
jgi:polar amino acid transport system substrate-binding protein